MQGLEGGVEITSTCRMNHGPLKLEMNQTWTLSVLFWNLNLWNKFLFRECKKRVFFFEKEKGIFKDVPFPRWN